MRALQPETDSVSLRPQVDDRLLLICALATGAGLIHVLAAIGHLDEYTLYALFFALLAPAQIAWSIAVYRTRSRRLLVLGAIGFVLIAVLWGFSRTTGLPVGPDPWQPESLGTLDVAATANELVLAVLIVCRLHPPSTGFLRLCERSAVAIGVVLLLATSLILVGPGHEH